LGAAKPVVATDFNLDLKKITGDLVAYCRTADEFSDALRNALITDSAQLQNRRMELAKQHTWTNRVYDINNLIENQQKKEAVS
jgi:hypothetical protein